jgi:hypothetical protein
MYINMLVAPAPNRTGYDFPDEVGTVRRSCFTSMIMGFIGILYRRRAWRRGPKRVFTLPPSHRLPERASRPDHEYTEPILRVADFFAGSISIRPPNAKMLSPTNGAA